VIPEESSIGAGQEFSSSATTTAARTMPREQRKRGKKHKNPAPDQAESYEENHSSEIIQEATPSWITHAPKHQEVQNLDEPFGQADQEVRAYFRTVDTQIKQWIEDAPHTVPVEGEDDGKPCLFEGRAAVQHAISERKLFFLAALQEMSGKELVLATDPECSTILERMLHSMDDFARRVFMDALSGSSPIWLTYSIVTLTE
jgi:nucleolar protein 9